MSSVRYLSGDFENRRTELFNRINRLAGRVRVLGGVVQNQLPDKMSEFNVGGWTYTDSEGATIEAELNQWRIDLAQFLNDFYTQHKG